MPEQGILQLPFVIRRAIRFHISISNSISSLIGISYSPINGISGFNFLDSSIAFL